MNYFVLSIYLFSSFSIYTVENWRKKPEDSFRSARKNNIPVMSMDDFSYDIKLPRRLQPQEQESRRQSMQFLNQWEGFRS
jgi:hypothetical protein